ncbi:MAG: HAD-IA family hydrolase [Actinomycetota bacterium]
MRLLLDLGGVVIRTPFEMLSWIGSPPWHGPFDPDADPLWQKMQRLQITERDYWEKRAREVFEGDDPVKELFRVVLDHAEEEVVRPEMIGLLAKVDRPASLTNDMARFHSPEWVARMTILSRFEPLIDLSHKPFLKPDPKAFEFALATLGHRAEDVLFVDDQPNNLVGASAVGMRTVWFDVTDVAGSIERIEVALDGT